MSSRQKSFRILKRALLSLAGTVFIFAIAAGVYDATTQTNTTQQAAQETVNYDDAVFYNGDYYLLNENILTVLLIGNDENKNNADSEYSGQCDALVLLVIDTEAATLEMFNIPRDTIASIAIQDVDGNYLRDEKQQIALAYAYGADDNDACELTVQAVSKLLYNIEIDYYARLDLSGVATANDLIGGVTLTLLEDFTDLAYANGKSDPDMILGETITLTGEQAYLYVQYRNVWDGLSSAQRVKRQSQYVSAYINQAKVLIKENPFVVLTYYAALNEYLYTNFPISEMVSLATIVSDFSFSSDSISTLEGEYQTTDTYLEFYLDEDATLALVLETFYTKISSDASA